MMNLAKLIELREYLETHEDEVLMSSWIDVTECGTTACAAGWTVLLDGVSPPEGITPTRLNPFTEFAWMIDPESKTSRWVDTLNEDLSDIEEGPYRYAKRVLGLDDWDAITLFESESSAKRAVRYLDALIERAREEENAR